MNAPYAGALPGRLSTDHNGGASFRVDIDIPPGISGAVPEIALCYSSLAGNGLLGVGWNLSGLSVIERCASTLAQDGFLGGITFGDGDRLVLDQARLVPRTGDSYFGVDTVYETEIQSWHRVVPVYLGTPGRQGPDAFEVTAHDGRCFRYGATPDSQGVISPANPSIRAWYLSSITDTCGNTIEFSYIDAGAGGTKAPSTIAYSSNGVVTARRAVRFTHEARSDVQVSYVAGNAVSTALRLQSVATSVDGNVVSSYTLAYENGAATCRSRLLSITRSDGAGLALPPTTFTWQEATADFAPAAALDTEGQWWGGSWLPMDIDGDGRVDVVYAYEGPQGELCLAIQLADANGLLAPPTPVAPSDLRYGGQLVTLDANGDGRTELVYASDNAGTLGLTLFTAQFVDGAWTLVPGPLNGAGPAGLAAGTLIGADVDGDGMADLVLAGRAPDGTLRLHTLFSDGTSFAPAEPDTAAPTAMYGGELFAFDANADGMDDVLYVTGNSDGTASFTLYRSTGRTGFVEVPGVLAGSISSGGRWIPLDVNADGNTDLVHVGKDATTGRLLARVVINDGCRFTPGEPLDTGLPYTALLLPATLTGSPSPELLALTHDPDQQVVLSVFRASVAGLAAIEGVSQPPAGTLFGGNVMPLDLRGTGFSDLVYAVESAGQQTAIVMPACGPCPDLLLSAVDGAGARYTATYASLADPGVYGPGDGAAGALEPRSLLHAGISGASYGAGVTPYPATAGAHHVLQRTAVPRYVVATTAVSDGIGGQWATNYRYGGALIDRSGRGWLGFSTIEVDDLDAGTTTHRCLNQTFPLTQVPMTSTVTRTSDGKLMTDARYGYEAPQAGSAFQVLCTSSSASAYSFADSGAPADTILMTATSYDQYGNVVQVATSGNALAAGSTLVQAYTIDEALWQLDLLASRAEYADESQAQLLQQDRYTYDPSTRRLLTHARWEDASGRWLQSSYGYDGFGHRVSSTDPSGSVTTTTYETGYDSFPVSESVSPAEGVILTRTFVHEPAFGRCISATDPAGAVRTTTYDGLGRKVAEGHTSPDGTPVEVLRIERSMAGGMLCQQTSHRLDWQADAWTSERAFLDGLGRTVRKERDPAGGTAPIVVISHYNERGAMLARSLPHFDGDVCRWSTWTLDAFGRVTSAVSPGADGTPVAVTQVYPAANTVETTIAAGTPSARTTSITYGMAARGHMPLRRQDAAGGITTYAYDGLGHLLSLSDPTGIVTQASYDTLGRQVATSLVVDGVETDCTTVVYDDLERTATETSAAGSMMLIRDRTQRLVEKRTSAGDVTLLSYDDADMPFALGRLASVLLPSGDQLRYAYDPDGNVARRETTLAGTTSVLTERHLPSGERACTVFPDGSIQTNTRGPNGALVSIDFAGPGSPPRRVVDYGNFDALDNPATVTYANGIVSTCDYDVFGRLASKQVTDASGAVVFEETVRRSPTDAVIAMDGPASQSQLAYDVVGRVQSVQQTGTNATTDFAYDLSGNCTAAGGTATVYDGYAPLRGTGTDPFTASYDDAGGLVLLERDAQSTTCKYDGERQLVGVEQTSPAGSASATMTYDHFGRRLTKQENETLTCYVAPGYEIVKLPDGSVRRSCIVGESGTRDYIATVADTQSCASIDGIPDVGEAYFACDHLGSTRVVFDASGGVAGQVAYDLFGTIAERSGTSGFRYGFVGREFDSVAGAFYLGARYYDPRLRHFTTPDNQLSGTLVDRDTSNRYAYVASDPASLIDPTGHSWASFGLQLGFGVGLVVAGVVVVSLSGGTANMAGSTLIGAGVGGLSYDISSAVAGKAQDVSWRRWGVQVGLGAATGLLTGGVAVGATSVCETAGLGAGMRCIAMGSTMALTSGSACVLSALATNATSGSSLSSGLVTAAVSGVVAGGFGGGIGGGIAGAAADRAAANAAAEVAAGAPVADAAAAGAAAPDAADGGLAPGEQAPGKPYWNNYVRSLARNTTNEGTWAGWQYSPSWPRFLFGSVRGPFLAATGWRIKQ